MSYRILGIVRGTYSGVPELLFARLAKKNDIVKIFDSNLSKPLRRYSHLKSYLRTAIALHDLPTHPTQWRQLTDKNKWRWVKETELCEREINCLKDNIDFVLQIGSKHGVCKKEPVVPYVVYTDGTRAISEREFPMGRLWPSEVEKAARMKLETELYQNASVVFTFSNFARMSVITDYGIEDNKVATVYAGANLREIPLTLDKDYSNKTILFVGKDFYRKGGPTLIKAFKEVKKVVKDAKLVIVSEPNLNFPSRIHTVFDFFGIKVSKPKINLPDLIFKSQVPYEELIQLYKDASIFVMPSIQENFGHVFLEAMAYKTPCIGTTVDAMPEIIEEGKTGFLVPPNDYKQLSDRLILILEDENMMKQMGEQGRKRVEKYFTWDLVVDRMTKEFHRAI
jgi:glycosyltransferase involved in cell wall biosynthesis